MSARFARCSYQGGGCYQATHKALSEHAELVSEVACSLWLCHHTTSTAIPQWGVTLCVLPYDDVTEHLCNVNTIREFITMPHVVVI